MRVAVLAALLLVPGLAYAQGSGAITGTVYDSLVGAPLAGARVWVRGITRDATTDRVGRFRIDSVPAGSHIVAFEHPDLDSIGISANLLRVDVADGAVTAVALATRSLATLRRAACGERFVGPAGDSSVVFGAVRDAESGTRLAGATVYVAWDVLTRTGDGGVAAMPQTVVARTDSVGSFYACGVPYEINLTTLARADTFTSGALELRVGRRQLLRRDITVSREPLRLVTSGPRSTAVQPDAPAGVYRGQATLSGVVTEERGAPRAGAIVSVDDVAVTATTDERGRFILTGLPSGTRMVSARVVGYSAARQPVELRNRDTVRVALQVRAITILDTMTVIADARLARLHAEIERRRTTHGGTVLLEEEIRRRGNTRSLFFGVPNVITTGTHSVRYEIYIQRTGARWCSPTIYIDGNRATLPELQAYQNNHLVALEVYPRSTGEIDRFASPDGCGIILAWTKLLR